MLIDWDWKGYLLAFASANCIITFLYEKFALNLIINLWYKHGKKEMKEEILRKGKEQSNVYSIPVKSDLKVEMKKI